jgi:uncharacterized membrane-anchored protein YhcB (DUF1043 family)
MKEKNQQFGTLLKRVSDQIKANQEENRTELRGKQDTIDELKREFDEKFALTALKSTVEEFVEHMKQYAKFEHIIDLREDVLPKVAEFTRLINIYT